MKYILLISIILNVTGVVAQSPTIDSLKQIVALQKHDTVELNALLNLSNEFLRRDLSLAKQYSSELIKLANNPTEVKWLSAAYNYLITIYQQTGKPDSSRYFLARSEAITKQNASNGKIKYNFNQAAGLFYKNSGEYNQALPYMLDNLRIWTKPDENRAGLLLNLGNLYSNMGEYKKSTDYHLQSLRLFETLKNLRGQSFCLHSLGNDFFNLNQLTTAKKYYERSLQVKKQLGDTRGTLNTMVSMGDVHKDLNEHQKSETYYQKALVESRSLKFPKEEARILHQSGLLYRRMGEMEKARTSFTQSMALSVQLGDSITYKRTKSELINLDFAEQKNKEIELQLLDGLNTLIRTGDRQQEAIEYHRMSEFYTQRKDFEKALYYLKKHESLTDSVEGNEVLVQLKELEEKYSSEKREKEIELLKKDQELQTLELQQQRANTTIIVVALISVLVIGTLLINRYRVMNRIKRQAELERMRQNIARDLHDDIGSTLSSINIMSKVAMNQTDNLSHLQKISTYSSRMMESMSDMVWSINPVNDSVDQMLVKMKEFTAEMLEPKNIQYDFQHDEAVTEIKLDVEKRKSLFLIFKEAINNAAKYSEATKVSIGLNRVNGSLQLMLHDNGKGFDASTVVRGNGLKNMAARAQAIKSTWTHVSEPGKGTTISIQVPIT
jgi:two-component system sensor histidine kinase UhpB